MTMIEKVARAIYDAAEKEGGYVGTYEFGLVDDVSTCLDGDFNLKALARAAIEAMREPTEAMLDAGYCDAPPVDAPLADVEAHWATLSPEDIWPSMIDAALNEKAG